MTNYFIISKSLKTNSGLYDLFLNAYADGEYIGQLIINSGIASKQNFRTFKDQVKGELEPIPEGEYDLGALMWAGGKGNYHTMYQEVKSPIWVTVVRSRAIGFHLDGDRDYAPGSAGCPVFKTMFDLKVFVSWYEKYGNFTKCYVDWGLKYVRLPEQNETIQSEIKPVANVPAINLDLCGKKVQGKVIDGVSYVDLRTIADVLDLDLSYDKETHTAVLNK